MNRIAFDIVPGASGQNVIDLQDGLKLLLDRGALDVGVEHDKLLAVLADERANASFRDGTGQLVQVFQKQHGLDTTGSVDEKTALALNAAFQSLGAFDPKPVPKPAAASIVGGHVRDDQGAGFGGLLVRAFNVTDRGDVRIGADTSDADGAYSISYGPLPDGSPVRLQLVVTDDAGDALAKTDVMPDPGTLVVVDLAAKRNPPAAEPRRLAGMLMLEHGAPADAVELRLYHVAFGGAITELARTTTTQDGAFAFGYDPGANGLNLEVRALSPAGDEVPLSRDLTHMGGEPSGPISLVAPTRVQPPQAEYRRLADALTVQVGGDLAALAGTIEDQDRQDLSALNGATGWDARLIALAATAHRLAKDTTLPAEALYGLLRAGLPSDKLMLAQLDPAKIGEALGRLQAAGVVELDAAQIADITGQFRTFATATRLGVPAPGSTTTYGDLLTDAGLDAAKDPFTDVFLGHRGDAADLWDSARAAGVSEPTISRLQLQGKLAFLAGNSGRVTRHLLEELSAGDAPGGPAPAGDAPGGPAPVTAAAAPPRGPVQLVALDLHDPEQWKARVRTLAADPADLDALIPVAYQGATVDDRLDSYASDMARKVRVAYPTEVVGRLVANDTINLGAGKEAAVAVLAAAGAQGFRFGVHPVEAFVKNRGIAVAGMTGDEVAAGTQQLKTLQRVYQITPGSDAMPVLMELGLTSAYDVTGLREGDFYTLFDAKYFAIHHRHPTTAEQRLVWRKAQQVSSMTYNLFAVARKLDSDPILPMVSGTRQQIVDAKKGLSAALKDYPTMESLFGAMDFCECEHCQSVLSPAAYLVDLLQYLEGEPQAWANFIADWQQRNGTPYSGPYLAPYAELVRRRPDVANIPLTCENTNVELPYIDVVNEILEFYVANGALTDDAARDTGEASSEDLLAEPQYVVAKAYEILRGDRYPLALPFDLWLETVRQFCQFAGAPLAQVLETLRESDDLVAPGQAYDRSATFVESLRFSPDERAVFADANPLAAWWELFGYTSEADALPAPAAYASPRVDLKSAAGLARRLGVTYKELVELLETAFINPNLAALRLLDKIPARIDELQTFLEPANVAFLAANRDLLGAVLNGAQQARLAALAKDAWERLTNLGAFDDRLAAYATRFGVARPTVDAGLAAVSFQGVLVLADPDAGCDFEATAVQFADGQPASPISFLRLNLFVRLWRKLGWTMAEVDRALVVLMPSGRRFDEAGLAHRPLETALVHMAHLKALDERLRVAKPSRLTLLTLWSDIDTGGKDSTYGRLFLSPTILRNDQIFDNPTGDYLSAAWLASQGAGKPADFVLIRGHLSAVRSALGLTADEVTEILADAELPPDAGLSISNLSILYRYGLLAKALKLSVRDLIVLKVLSGLDPFHPVAADALADITGDYPFSQTLAFADVADQVRQSGLKVADLDFLLRRRFDPVGPYRPNPDATFALLKGLGDGVRTIRAANAVPADPGGLTEDLLAEKLGLLLAPDATQRLLRMLRGEEVLDAGSRGFFDDHLKKGRVREADDTGFLDDADYPGLFAAVQALQAIDPADGAPEIAAKQAANELVIAANLTELLRRRTRVAQAFLPVLQDRLIRQLAVQALAADAGADPALVEALVADRRLVELPGAGAAGSTLLAAFAATGAQGVDVEFFASATAADPQLDNAPIVAVPDTTVRPKTDAAGAALPAANSARFAGFLAVPANGAYRFLVELEKQAAEGRLIFPHLPQPTLLDGTAAADGALLGTGPNEFVELKAGVPYRFAFEAGNLAGGRARVLVQGETSPRGGLDQLQLFPASALDASGRAYELLTSALLLLGTLGIDEREASWILQHRAAWAGIDLAGLPTEPTGDTAPDVAAATGRFGQFLRLAAYARLKRDMAGGTGDLIGVFEADATTVATRLTDAVYPLIAGITRREAGVVQATAEALAAAPSFGSDVPLARLWAALVLVERLGAPAAAIRDWTRIVAPGVGDDERFVIARGVKETIRARFDRETWRSVAQPIFDKLRQRQRDALVSHVMRHDGFTRPEQVYEQFLLDPAMEPVVQTSRIRLAIASVQLFVQRCLLNLEGRVHPIAILTADQWEWMKRYRVWEANRKIFLFPENWLEPEFRDDKTHLFADLEGVLLKDDVTADMVEDAFIGYLQRLEELARLDIVAMHLETKPDFGKNTLHVFGRTYSQPYKYFYRRYANDMWTPWEPVGAEIEGDHLAPVVWRNRLYLFWVTFLESAQPSVVPTSVDTSRSIPLPDLAKSVEAQLHWSEYAHGTWTTRQSGGYNQPADVKLRVDGLSSAFSAQDVFVHVSVVADPTEGHETPQTTAEAGVYVHLGAPIYRAFHLVSRHAAPEAADWSAPPSMPFTVSSIKHRATRFVGDGALTVTFSQRISTEPGKTRTEPVSVLANTDAFTLLACDNTIGLAVSPEAYAMAERPAAVQAALEASIWEIEALMKPVFFTDAGNTLFVEPDVTERTIEEWQEWVTRTPVPVPDGPTWFHDPGWWDRFVKPAWPRKLVPDPVGPVVDGGDPWSIIHQHEGMDWLVNDTTGLFYDGRVIGPGGGVPLDIVPAAGALDAVAAPSGSVVRLAAGSEVQAGAVGLLARSGSGASTGLRTVGAGISVVGGGGLNAALQKNAVNVDAAGVVALQAMVGPTL
jgi:hypothetical protein